MGSEERWHDADTVHDRVRDFTCNIRREKGNVKSDKEGYSYSGSVG